MENMMEVTRWTKNAGIEIRGSFMLALPGENPSLAEQTIQNAIKLDPEYAQFSICTPYPGTELYNEIASKVSSIAEQTPTMGRLPGDMGGEIYIGL